jgi:hypothetical protein
MDLQIGDIVHLKSHPNIKMTIVGIVDMYVTCFYYNAVCGKFEQMIVLSNCLTKYNW